MAGGLCDCLPQDWVAGRGCEQVTRLNAAVESLAECMCSAQCALDEVAETSETDMGTDSPTDAQLNLLFPNCVDCTDLNGKIVYLHLNSGDIKMYFFNSDTCTWTAQVLGAAFKNSFRTQTSNILLLNSQTGNTAGLVVKLGPTVIWNAASGIAPAVNDLISVNIWWGYRIEQFAETPPGVAPVDDVAFQLQFTGAFNHTVNLGTGAQPTFRNGMEASNFSVSRLVTAGATDLTLTILANMTGTAPIIGGDPWIWEIFIRYYNATLNRITHVI